MVYIGAWGNNLDAITRRMMLIQLFPVNVVGNAADLNLFMNQAIILHFRESKGPKHKNGSRQSCTSIRWEDHSIDGRNRLHGKNYNWKVSQVNIMQLL